MQRQVEVVMKHQYFALVEGQLAQGRADIVPANDSAFERSDAGRRRQVEAQDRPPATAKGCPALVGDDGEEPRPIGRPGFKLPSFRQARTADSCTESSAASRSWSMPKAKRNPWSMSGPTSWSNAMRSPDFARRTSSASASSLI
ncbi:MAG TPA: hypothetical protein VI384_01475 [Candidatus Dormibacteraeota bacterium]